jgi:hypothetical protein
LRGIRRRWRRRLRRREKRPNERKIESASALVVVEEEDLGEGGEVVEALMFEDREEGAIFIEEHEMKDTEINELKSWKMEASKHQLSSQPLKPTCSFRLIDRRRTSSEVLFLLKP